MADAGDAIRQRHEALPPVLDDLKTLVEPETRGDPMQPLLGTSKSLRHLVRALADMGHKVCRAVVANLLRSLNDGLQGNAKTKEGGTHPDRNASSRRGAGTVEHINAQVKAFQASGDPVISVDTKKHQEAPRSIKKHQEASRRRNWWAMPRTMG